MHLPSPTPELLLMLAALKELTQDDPALCSKFVGGVYRRATRPRRADNVVVLRQVIPQIDAAEEMAGAALCAMCALCGKRGACPGPVQ